MTSPSATPLPSMRSHWWWRPGWSVGRRFYTWHLTFARAAEVVELARQSRPHLDHPGLDVIPEQWLHLTVQGVGFAHEVDHADVEKIAAAARTRLLRIEPFDITVGPAVVDPEVVRLRVEPAATVEQLRRQLRGAIADVWGPDRVPETEDGFLPHLSLAYSNRDGDMRPILDAVAEIADWRAVATVRHADLILLHRDDRCYEWTTVAQVPLGSAT